MKRIRKICLVLLMFLPILIYAQTYNFNDSVREGNNYINKTVFKDRYKYLIVSNQKFIMNDNGTLSTSSRFTNGGFLNSREYCISTGNNNCTGPTYLIIPASYWTLSGSESSRYYISNISGLSTQSDSYKSSVRVTEFVKPRTEVKGSGKYTDPWIFNPEYLVILTSSNKKVGYFGNSSDKKATEEKYASKDCIKGSGLCANFDINIEKGYENNPNDGCGLNLISNNKVNNNISLKKYELSNIKDDINCIVMFRKKEFTIKYNCNSGTGNIPNQKVKYGDNFRLTSSVCTRSGYRQDGWLDGNNNRWNEASAPFNYDDGERGISNKTLTLKANWVKCNAGTYSNTARNTCDTCPAGRYSAAGAGSCSICAAGRYSAAGSSSCSTCAAGTYSAAGSGSCANCPAGRYSAAGAGSCSICPAGTYSGTRASSCTPCATGYHSAAGASSCTLNTYTIVYNSNGGTGSTASSVHTYSRAKNLTANGFSRSGYSFDGWATSPTGGVQYSNSQSVVNLTATNGATINLYAHWKIAYSFAFRYTGSFSYKDGSAGWVNKSNASVTLMQKNWQVKFLSSGTLTVTAIASNADVFLVGGGGGAGGCGDTRGGGGGGGGFTTTWKNFGVNAQNYGITIGGGAGCGGRGGTSSAFGYSAAGGNPGSSFWSGGRGGDGGSGGGGCFGGNGFPSPTGDGGSNGSYGNTGNVYTYARNGGYNRNHSGGSGCSSNNGCKVNGQKCSNTRAFCESSGELYAGGGAGSDHEYCGPRGAGGGAGGRGGGWCVCGCQDIATPNYGGGGAAGGGSSGIVILRNHR